MLSILSIVAFALVALSSAYLLVAIYGTLRFRGRLHAQNRSACQPLTVLKPLCGDEVELAENLRSFCRQNHPDFQVIFGVRDHNDPAAHIARGIIDEFPNRDISLVVDNRVIGSNLKVSNLVNMAGAAKHDILVVSDSDMRVEPDYLSKVAAAFEDPGVGAATCLYSGSARGGLASKLGAMFINDWFFPSALIPALFGKLSFCFGATMAVRRDALSKMGGFESLADVLADDYMLGNRVIGQGRRIALVPYVVKNIVTEPDLRTLFRHEMRWARTIRNVQPGGYGMSLITEAFPLSMLAAGLLWAGGSPIWMIVGPVILSLALRTCLHVAVNAAVGNPDDFTPWLIPLRDAFSIAVRVSAYFGTRVHWRGQVLNVHADSRLREMPSVVEAAPADGRLQEAAGILK